MTQLPHDPSRETPPAAKPSRAEARPDRAKPKLAAVCNLTDGQGPAPPQPSDDSISEDWRSLTVVSVPVAAKLLGLSRQAGYDAVARGDLPALRIGRRLVVPVAKLRRLLGELPPLDEAG